MFWLNSPSTVSIMSADNLSRAERYLTATAGANGDYYLTIPNGASVTTNDLIHVRFPVATNAASDARISIDGGTTYVNVKTSINIPASAIQNARFSFVYDSVSAAWIPIEPVRWTSGDWVISHYPDGMAQANGNITGINLTSSGAFGTGGLYLHNGTFTIPTGVFNATPKIWANHPAASTVYGAANGYATSATAGGVQIIKNNSTGTTVTEAVLAIGTWK
jgi:hypothetical protein